MAKAKQENPNVVAYQKVVNDLVSGYSSEAEGPYSNLFSSTFEKYGVESILMKLDESVLALNNVAEVQGGIGALVHELQMIANLAVMSIMELEASDEEWVADFPETDEDGDSVEPESDDEDGSIEEEMEELTKPQLMIVANKCAVTGINKKMNKTTMIEKILDQAPDDDIYNAIDELDEEDEK